MVLCRGGTLVREIRYLGLVQAVGEIVFSKKSLSPTQPSNFESESNIVIVIYNTDLALSLS